MSPPRTRADPPADPAEPAEPAAKTTTHANAVSRLETALILNS